MTTIGPYGSYARDEANENSDIDIFYDRDSNFGINSEVLTKEMPNRHKAIKC